MAMAELNLITDRTQADVDYWRSLQRKGYAAMTDEEKAAWNAGLKGAYNASDLNRVGAALNYIRDRLFEARYIQPDVFEARVDWRLEEIPTVDEMTEYLGYVSVIREALGQFPTTPLVPGSANALNYSSANDIEQILVDVDGLITRMMDAVYYSGELFSGEV